MKRLAYCDLLRIIAILSVIAIHSVADYRDLYINNNHVYYFILTALDSLTRAGVPLFFMLTGIFMLTSRKNLTYKQFLKKRLPKLIIPLLIASVVYYYICAYFVNDVREFSLIKFWDGLNSGDGSTKYHLWFMYSIISIYLFIPFLQKFIQNLTDKELRNLIVLIFLLGNVLVTINFFLRKFDHNFLGAFQLPYIIIYTNYLFLGYYLQNHELKSKQRRTIYLLGIFSLIAMPIADLIGLEQFRTDRTLIAQSCFPFLFASAVFVFIKYNYDKFKISKRLEVSMGKIAPIVFYIYLVHVLVLEIAKKILYKCYSPERFLTQSLTIFFLFVITSIFSFLIAIFIGKIENLIKNKLPKRRTKDETKQKK